MQQILLSGSFTPATLVMAALAMGSGLASNACGLETSSRSNPGALDLDPKVGVDGSAAGPADSALPVDGGSAAADGAEGRESDCATPDSAPSDSSSANPWWKRPGWDQSGRQAAGYWLSGTGYDADPKLYPKEIARLDICHGSAHRQMTAFDSWDLLAGGPSDKNGDPVDASGKVDPGFVDKGSWLHWPGTNMMGPLGAIARGKGLIIIDFMSVKKGEPKKTQGMIWKAIAAGTYDRYYRAAARRLHYNMVTRYNKDADQLMLRCNKEGFDNSENDLYGLRKEWSPITAVHYRDGMKRIADVMRKAYGPGLKFSFSPCRRYRVPGPASDPQHNKVRVVIAPGTYDVLTMSWHPSSIIKSKADFDKVVQGSAEAYGFAEIVQAAKELGLPVASDEWSPKHDQQYVSPAYGDCYKWTHDYWASIHNKTGVPFIYDALFAADKLLVAAPSWMNAAQVAQWNKGRASLKALWAGKK